MSLFMEKATTLELEFRDGTLKIISLEGLPTKQKTQWRDWASKLLTGDSPIIGWSIN